uniref:Phosphoglycerate kinase n=1 Tax=Anthurium amnicola TaxID=1678845 RepID=A0A1D1ZJZ3_9ARAE
MTTTQLPSPFGRSPPPSYSHQCHNSTPFPKAPLSRYLSCLFSGNGTAFRSSGNGTAFRSRGGLHVLSSGNWPSPPRAFQSRAPEDEIMNLKEQFPAQSEIKIFDGDVSNHFHVQTLRNFPKEKLKGEVVAVRFDSTLVLDISCTKAELVNKALYTIKYLYGAGAKVLLLSSWGQSNDPILISTETFADYLSSILQLKVLPANCVSDFGQLNVKNMRKGDILLFENLTKFKGERANCLDFSRKLSAGVGVFVNDDFSVAHKILASTVGISRFCYSSVAGFHFEEELHQLASIAESTRRPYIAVIGGGKFLEKRTLLHILALKCDGLMFVGMMAFQIMHALGLSVPMNLVDHDSFKEVLELVELAKDRNIEIIFPDDFWCVDSRHPRVVDLFPNDGILPGWTPVDLGPISLENIFSRLLKYKKVLLIGPMNIRSSGQDVQGVPKLAIILGRISGMGCEVVVVGNANFQTFVGTKQWQDSFLSYKHFENASVIWEFLKGRTLPGVAALDRAYPFDLDWGAVFSDPTQPLVVDIGSGNGLFLLRMARRWQTSNFLGLEINRKLVARCLDDAFRCGVKNVYFIATNATSTFRSIISSYRGKLVLVSIQCPNPDFNKTDHRWKMVQRMLVDAIIDLLVADGKVFLQSDIEDIARRMKEEFVMYGKGKLALDRDHHGGWIKENPFGVRSDWEQHVLDRGAPMYRVLLRKVHNNGNS